MTMHRFGMATHQWLSRAAIVVGYRAVCNDNHVQDTWRDRIQICHISEPQKALNMYQILSSFWGWGLGMRLTHTLYIYITQLLHHSSYMHTTQIMQLIIERLNQALNYACIGLPIVIHDNSLTTVCVLCIYL